MSHPKPRSFAGMAACALLAMSLSLPVLAAKEGTLTAARGAAPVVSTIEGAPLTVRVGDEHSYQILNDEVPGVGQIYPSGSSGTADMGWLVHAGGVQYGPDFSSHSGSATGSLGTVTAYTGRTISPVSGSGSAADPFVVTVSNALGASGLTTNETIRYVNGDNFFRSQLTVSNASAAAQDVKVFLGGDIYLAGSDRGIPYLEAASNAIGGNDCGTPASYYILFIPQTPTDAHSGAGYSNIWSQIGAGALDNALSTTSCIDNGAALQWNRSIPANGSVTIQAVISFGDIPSLAQFDITQVTPGNGAQGTTVPVTISGLGFAPGMDIGFGAGITVSNLTVVDGNTATATLTIAANATIGPRDVTGINADSTLTATLPAGFQVTGTGTTPFEISSVTPASGQQGTTVNVTLQGLGFAPGMQVAFGNGITVSNLVVSGATSATATLTIAANAAVGPRDVIGTSADGNVTDTLANGFRVTAASGQPGPARPVPASGTAGLLLLMLSAFAAGLLFLRRNG